ncbi:KfrB domain-containing protein [Burkholderia cenocepacia]|uniref:KfrB domain-containing protein n=1 Tax=Burkholderia cenocepacia TaxID=95486 RepID=UPI002ABE7ED1|nr:KfrB domain-containing protein [Burkholderia cenocepacia]
MRHRVLVMNGQRIVQNEQAPGTWQNEHVDKAGQLKPGIYNIYTATQADRGKASEGVIVHADKQGVYQQVGRQFVKHDRQNFDKVPEIGSAKSITYDQKTGRANVAVASETLGRKLSR